MTTRPASSLQQDASRHRRRRTRSPTRSPAAPTCWRSRRRNGAMSVVKSLANGTDLFDSTISCRRDAVGARAERFDDLGGFCRRSPPCRSASRASQSARSPCSATPSPTTSTRLAREPRPPGGVGRRSEHRAPAAFLDPPSGELGPWRRQQPGSRQGRRARAGRGRPVS